MRVFLFMVLLSSLLVPGLSGASEINQAWSTLVGGNLFDEGMGIVVDSLGHSYVAGWTRSEDFPVTAGAYDTSRGGVDDVIVFKLGAAGDSLIWATYLGGIEEDEGEDIALDVDGNVYVIGSTRSPDFPTTPGAFDTTYADGQDIIVFKLNSLGNTLIFSTYLGGTGWDYGYDIAVNSSGMIYLTGKTPSSEFPTTPGAFDTTLNGDVDAFLVNLNASGSSLSYATFLGGSGDDRGQGLFLDNNNDVYITGSTYSDNFPVTPGAYDTARYFNEDAFVTKFELPGGQLLYSTYLGGRYKDFGQDVFVDGIGQMYVCGRTNSDDFPTTTGAFNEMHNGYWDVFVVKFTAAGDDLIYATYVGGSHLDDDKGMTVSESGEVCVVGYTQSVNFPTTVGALDSTLDGDYDGFAFKLNADGDDLVYSSYLGGWHEDCAYDIDLADGYAYLTGKSRSYDFFISPGAYDSVHHGYGDVFVTKMRLQSNPIDDLKIELESGGKSSWGHFRLTWSEPADDIWIDRYIVYRSFWSWSIGDSIGGTEETTFLDEYMAGDPYNQYFYTIIPVDGHGIRSAPSNMAGEWDVMLVNESPR